MKKSIIWVGVWLLSVGLGHSIFADTNATSGVQNEESIVFTGGPFELHGLAGTPGNGTFSTSMTGGFNANRLTWSGTMTSVLPSTWGSDAVLQMTDSGSTNTYIELNFGQGTYSGQLSFDGTMTDLTDSYPNGIDPAGAWSFEFFDSFDDGAGVEQTIDSLTLSFQEFAINDSDGSFSLGSLSQSRQSANSIGEMGTEGLLDYYSFTMDESGLFSVELSSDEDGFTGQQLDSEIAIYDALGKLIISDDDGGSEGLYSGIFDQLLNAGDYTLVIGGFDTEFGSDIDQILAGNDTGDYEVNVMVDFTAVPEPAAGGLLALLAGAWAIRRRKR